MKRRVTIWNRLVRIYDFFRYDLPRFTSNLWTFRKALFRFRPDIEHTHWLFLQASLREVYKMHAINWTEEDIMQRKRLESIARALNLIHAYLEDTYIEQAEKELGYEVSDDPNNPFQITEKDAAIFNRALVMEEKQWEELFRILKGQSITERMPTEWGDGYPETYDGTGIKSWGD